MRAHNECLHIQVTDEKNYLKIIIKTQSSRLGRVLKIKILFFFLNESICCDPSLEPSTRDSSNEWPQLMFI